VRPQNLAAAGPGAVGCDHPAMSFELGDPVPAFTLDDTVGSAHAVPADPAPAATVLVVTCNHCPYVVAWNPRLRAVAEDYAPRDVRFLAINANDAQRFPADSPAAMKRFVSDHDWPIPYLYDETQEVARALDALGHAARLRPRRRPAPALPRRARRRSPGPVAERAVPARRARRDPCRRSARQRRHPRARVLGEVEVVTAAG
jgi:AhpC/TSA family protein